MAAISLRENPPYKYDDLFMLIHRKCMATQYAVTATVHSTLHHPPGGLAFSRDMIDPFTSMIDWQQNLQHKQQTII